MTRILCVEDNEDNLFMLQRRLTHAGFEVRISMNGAQAVDWAKTLLPDLIVMDLHLPGLDGWEATRRLKSQPETKHIPIMGLTVGEIFYLADLARDCAEDKRYEFLFVAPALPVTGAVGSPVNPLAIK